MSSPPSFLAANPDVLINEFSKRSCRLKKSAVCFLILIAVLLGFAGYFVYEVGPLTNRDAPVTFDDRLKSTDAQLVSLKEESNQLSNTIGIESNHCLLDYTNFFERVGANQGAALPNTTGSIQQSRIETEIQFGNWPTDVNWPDGDGIAYQMETRLRSDDLKDFNVIGMQLTGFGLSREYFVSTKEGFRPILAAIAKHRFDCDKGRIDNAIKERREIEGEMTYLHDLRKKIYDDKVEQEAEKGIVRAEMISNNSLIVRMAQVTINRFGMLAVVGFFVSLLASLYKYNIKLSAFYLSRADLLRITANRELRVDQFAELADVCTPNVKFSKTPGSPLKEISDLLTTGVRALRK